MCLDRFGGRGVLEVETALCVLCYGQEEEERVGRGDPMVVAGRKIKSWRVGAPNLIRLLI